MRNIPGPYFWLALHRTKVRWRFRKFLWPSQNIWILILVNGICSEEHTKLGSFFTTVRALLIMNRSWILTVHKVRIYSKSLLKTIFGLQKWGKKYTNLHYNGARIVNKLFQLGMNYRAAAIYLLENTWHPVFWSFSSRKNTKWFFFADEIFH